MGFLVYVEHNLVVVTSTYMPFGEIAPFFFQILTGFILCGDSLYESLFRLKRKRSC